MYFKNVLMLMVFVSLQACGGLSETVNLTIADGDIQGQINTTIRNNITYYNFRGIPYAQPPVGSLRLTSPVRNSPWNGTLDATNDKSECIQYSGTDYTTVYGQEDCLYINVYTPNYNATDLPVLVWIYGGSFQTGTAAYSMYGPDLFLEQDLVYVSFNYRLGVFGFLSTEDEACPGNWGIKDQILALNWVQENIAYFGGNPATVTIFGESAGAASVSLLLQTNLTNGLFARAIMNSGTTLNLWALNTRAATTATLVATNLGIITTNNTELVESLREVDAETLHSVGWETAYSLFLSNALRGLPYAPTMEPDVDGAVYVNPSDDALRAGNFTQVPVLMGINSNEAAAGGDLALLIRIYLLYYDVAVEDLTPYSMTVNQISRALAGANIKYQYFKLSSIGAGDSENFVNFVSADHFNRPIRRAAADMSNYTTVYFYQFGYEGLISGVERTVEGVQHAEDIYYLFRSYNNYTETDIKVSDTLVLLWSNFAKYGNPTPEEDESLNNTIWQAVDASSSDFNYMVLNESISQAVNPKQSDWEYYTRLWDIYGHADETTTY